MSKTECSLSLSEFLAVAANMQVQLGEQATISAAPREFSTGSFGWGASLKANAPFQGTIEQFLASPVITLNVGGSIIALAPKQFSTGSYGYGASEKITAYGLPCQLSANFTFIGSKDAPLNTVADTQLQCSINVTVIGSKDAPRSDATTEQAAVAASTAVGKPVAKKGKKAKAPKATPGVAAGASSASDNQSA